MVSKNDKNRSTDRREAARLQAERLRSRAKAAERKQRLVIGVIAVVVVALIAVAGFVIWQQSQRTLLTDFEGVTPAGSDLHGGIAVAGADQDSDAPEVQIYVDFSCPHCATFEQLHGSDLNEIADGGEAALVYHPVIFLNSGENNMHSARAANAFATVASESPEHALAFMEGLFEYEPGIPDEMIVEVAVEAGVPQEVADSFAEGIYNEWVEVASNQAQRDGIHGTPSVLIDGEEIANEQFGAPGSMAELIRAA